MATIIQQAKRAAAAHGSTVFVSVAPATRHRDHYQLTLTPVPRLAVSRGVGRHGGAPP